jgi:hypothetical protein
MARSIVVIKKTIIDYKNTTSLSVIKFKEEGGSSVGIANAFADVFSICINVLEQLWDLMKSNFDASIAKAGAGTVPWFRERTLEWQYGDAVKYANGVYAYDLINEEKKIIKFCSITETGNKEILVKVAKGTTPTALTSGEQLSLTDYLGFIRFAGTQVNIISQASDLCYINAIIYYDGQYSDVIQANVEGAITTYFNNISSQDNFDGKIVVNRIEDAIQAVEGVTYVKLNEVSLRPFNILFASRTNVFLLSSGINSIRANTASGHVIAETNSGYTLSDSLTYTAI